MRDTLELAALLFLLVLGHNVVRGSDRILRDTVSGFAIWLGTMAAITALMFRPLTLEVIVRIGVGVALVYAAFRSLVWARDLFRSLPRLPPPSRRRMKRLLAAAGYPQSVREEALGSLGGLIADRPALAAALLVSACEANPAPQELGAAITERLAKHVQAADELRDGFRELSGGEIAGDTALVDGVVLRYDVVVARKALRAARGNRRRGRLLRHWLRQLHNTRVHSVRAAALRQLGIEIPCVRDEGETAWERLERPGTILAFVFPLYAYIFLQQPLRAVLFSVCYATTLAYGAALIAQDSSAGWVFLAVAGLLHLSALIHLDVACGVQSLTPPGDACGNSVSKEEARRAAV